jgi:hypothetical protein
MGFELRDWRALAIGWAAALAVAFTHGTDFIVPVVAIGVSVGCWALWQ